MDRQEARDYINSLIDTELQKDHTGKGYICPICGSGSGKNGTGITTKDSKHYTCWAGCFSNSDYIDILKKQYNTDESGVFAIRHIDIDNTHNTLYTHNTKDTEPIKKEEQPQDFTAFYLQAHKDLLSSPEAMDYLKLRGIDEERIELFNLGYCEKWKPENSKAYPSKRIIVPSSSAGYLARAITENKLPKLKGGKSELFNAKELQAADGIPLFIVEGQFDAISLIQTGIPAVALASTTGEAMLIKSLREHPIDRTIVISLDNDEPGRKAQKELSKELSALNMLYIEADTESLYNGKKDANEAYISDRDGFIEKSSALFLKALDYKAELEEAEDLQRKETAAADIDNFLLKVQSRAYEPIPSGITSLDNVLGGGFLAQSLVIIGAGTSQGKTTLTAQILDKMALQGNRVLYFNLEMSREQMIAKSLSRTAYQAIPSRKVTAADIMQGYKWTEAQREIITNAAQEYKEAAQNISFNPSNIRPDLDSIVEYITREADRSQQKGNPAPIVCIDYIQLLQGREKEDARQTINRAVTELKGYATKYNTMVFVITAFNRDTTKNNAKATLESGRDTSALEYSADYYIALNFTEYESGKNDADIDALKNREDRDITLKVLKNRLGVTGRKIEFTFYPAYNTFIPKDTKHTYTAPIR